MIDLISELYVCFVYNTDRLNVWGECVTKEKDNVVFLSSAQYSLEEEAFNALESNDFEQALEKLYPLIEYGVRSYSVNTGLLISLINLQKFDEAEAFCEMILGELAKDDEDYVDYVDFHMMILYEKGQYLELIDGIEAFLDEYEVPPILEEKFELLVILATEMNQDLTKTELEKLKRAIEGREHQSQWQFLHNLKAYNKVPPGMVTKLLTMKQIHPVNKTFIFSWLKEIGEMHEITLEKFGQEMKVTPRMLPMWNEHPVYKNISKSMEHVEQNNPSLYGMINELVDAYCYVYYPIIPNRTVEELAEAFIYIASNQLNVEHNEALVLDEATLQACMEEINMAHSLYASIVPS